MATEEIIAHSDVDISFNPQVLQQQEVQQQDYQLTLKDLCNQWFTKLTSKNGNKKLDIMNSARCIVGEAYKFSENRIYNNDQEYVYGCRPCAEIAAEFIDLLVYPKEGNRDKEFDKQMDDNGFVTEDVLNNNKLVRKFLAHWSRDHINIQLNAVKIIRIDSYISTWTDLEEMYKEFCGEVESHGGTIVDRGFEHNPFRQQWVMAIFYNAVPSAVKEIEKWVTEPLTSR